MSNVGIVFPNQLFEEILFSSSCETIYLVEEFLFFSQYSFHKRKICFHRASMKFYENYLQINNKKVIYIDASDEFAKIQNLVSNLNEKGVSSIEYIDSTDFILEKRIQKKSKDLGIELLKKTSPLFLNSVTEIETYFSDKKRMFQTDFYKNQRKKRDILIDFKQNPTGGKWTFDDENRLKYPKDKIPPATNFLKPNSYYLEAMAYTQKYFSNNVGELDTDFIYPTTHQESKVWLNNFFKTRFSEFGHFEDSIVQNEYILHHGILTPMLNTGLLTPQFVIDEALEFSKSNEIPINSLEGFIRQIIGWREFIRAVYLLKGSEERTKNYWQFSRKIPASFWNGTTGIEPLDATIKKVLKSGYCHHIERLMVLGNFMLLCEFEPDEVYRWFMELFIDSYDWVMVPNVYGMSQFADGGIMSTKPYISGSNYLMKMSDYKKGEWQNVWDGLFWNFMDKHRSFFLQNPRLGMLIHTFDKMAEEKKIQHLYSADNFLKSL